MKSTQFLVPLLLFLLTKDSTCDSVHSEQGRLARTVDGNFYDKRGCSTNMDCPPWTYCNETYCQCGDDLGDTIYCNQSTLKPSDCYCVTYDVDTNRTYAGACIENCWNYRAYHPLPSNVTQLNEQMCGKWNRDGRLCGKCRENYYPLVYSFNMACMNCTEANANVLKFICTAFVPLTLFYFIVLFFQD